MSRYGLVFRSLSFLVAGALFCGQPAMAAGSGYSPAKLEEPFSGTVVLEQGRCFEWMFFGVRGSGEKIEGSVGIGPTLHGLFGELSSYPKFKGKLGSSYPANYKALPADVVLLDQEKASDWWFEQIVNMNHINLGLRALTLACPTSKIVLGGYSQGAVALSASYDVLLRGNDEILPKLRGAFLVGNPARRSSTALFPFLGVTCALSKVPQMRLAQYSKAIPAIGEACASQDEYNYEILSVRTPRSDLRRKFTVTDFYVSCDLFADFRLNCRDALDKHSSYSKLLQPGANFEKDSFEEQSKKRFVSYIRSFVRRVK